MIDPSDMYRKAQRHLARRDPVLKRLIAGVGPCTLWHEPSRFAALVRSIIDLGAALEIDTVAEGVENDKQRETLRSLGCRRAQGFFFARPLPASEFRELLG